ncbi:CsbD family protein [Paramicrobacterium fandaimingii]|uniref:CsbD family protein n=1 Tax=Paramicrobacterium fandaimingii TaxID=2708079 RepID=UPI001421CA58|nr:CsbD family protein [Microbacterium fandaimingii]
MGFGDKASNAAEDAKGKAKETVGDATDNEDLANEGRADQASASAKKAGENVKDAADNASQGVKDLFNK